jgi:predicted metalloendopeptidase
MKRLAPLALIALALGGSLAGCGDRAQAPRPSGLSVANMDSTVRPQDDFFRYANGGWFERTEIPADLPTIGSFVELFLESERKRHAILEELAQKKDLSPIEQKLGDFYATFMDSAAIEAKGIEPLQEEMTRIAAIGSKADLLEHFGRCWRMGVQTPAAVFVDGDFDDSKKAMLFMVQSGLGLPNRDYFLKNDPNLVAVRGQYEAYIAKLFGLAGVTDGARRARGIIALETGIAKAHWPVEDVRDASKTHNRYAVADLKTLSGDLDWTKVFGSAGIEGLTELNVNEPSYLTGLGGLVDRTSLEVWKDYATFKLLHASAPLLSAPFTDANFEFTRVVAGTRAQPERWKRGTRMVEGMMGMALGEIYVQRHFPPEAKARMDELVANVQAAMKDNIDDLAWMSPATRVRAQEKLAKFTPQIGYPKNWIDYGTLEIERGNLVGNVRRANAFEFQRQMNKLGVPVDPDEWGLTPQSVNAYYDPPLNKIVFPAAILQPPFFDMNADDAVNYGAIGGVIGHEISHGFDDQGRKYDGDGNLKDWWTAADDSAFNERADMLVAQFGGYSPLEGMNVNGRLTLGENIGDLSGLTIAYGAYRKSLGGKEAPVIDGLTGDQRFFLGWATIWRTKMTDQLLRMVLLSNPHSPGEYRVNGIVKNMREFYAAFGVQPGDPLYLDEAQRVKLW